MRRGFSLTQTLMSALVPGREVGPRPRSVGSLLSSSTWGSIAPGPHAAATPPVHPAVKRSGLCPAAAGCSWVLVPHAPQQHLQQHLTCRWGSWSFRFHCSQVCLPQGEDFAFPTFVPRQLVFLCDTCTLLELNSHKLPRVVVLP